MFTGLVQKVGILETLARSGGGCSLRIAHTPWPTPLEPGESIAVQGACLTVTTFGEGFFTADVLDETLARTALKQGPVNLERALALGDRLGGHIVSGHIDETGRVESIDDRGRDIQIRIACSPVFARQSVWKGSVAIDGISLTISGLGDDWFEVNIIPHTLSETTLRDRKPGDKVNLESDILGKYVARQLGKDTSGITLKTLEDAGFI